MRVLLLITSLLLMAGCSSSRTAPPMPAQVLDPRVAALLSAGERLDPASERLAQTLDAISRAKVIVADNLANGETIAFRARQVRFLATGQFVVQLNMEQGPAEVTNRALDVSIEGPGFFRVKVLDNIGDGTAYTRNGNLFLKRDGNLVVGLGEGYRLQPPISFPQGITEKDISISEDGTVTYKLASSNNSQTAGKLELVNFTNPDGLDPQGSSLYRETQASGPGIASLPGEHGTGITKQGSLEGSNVERNQEALRLEKLKGWENLLIAALRNDRR